MKLLKGTDWTPLLFQIADADISAGLKQGRTRRPCLAVVQVGEDPASRVYVGRKKKACEEVGIGFKLHILPEDTKNTELIELIRLLNADGTVDGILLQLPLPRGLHPRQIIEEISPAKDVDGLTSTMQGRTMLDITGFNPCTPAGVLALLELEEIPTAGKRVAVIGRSELVGKPLAAMLSAKRYDATVTLCHRKTPDLAEICRASDILISATGKRHIITADMVKPGAVVIDVGITRGEDGKLCGDVDFENVAPIASAVTPVPGGVGPMTVAILIFNTIEAWLNLNP